MKLISERQYDAIVCAADTVPGYLGIGLNVVTPDGVRCDPQQVRPGCFLAAANYYGRCVLYIEDDLTLTPCESE